MIEGLNENLNYSVAAKPESPYNIVIGCCVIRHQSGFARDHHLLCTLKDIVFQTAAADCPNHLSIRSY